MRGYNALIQYSKRFVTSNLRHRVKETIVSLFSQVLAPWHESFLAPSKHCFVLTDEQAGGAVRGRTTSAFELLLQVSKIAQTKDLEWP
jgi:hypothetical protein